MRIEIFSGDADLGQINTALDALSSNINFFRSGPESARKTAADTFRAKVLDWGEGLLVRGSLPIEGYSLAVEIVRELGQFISPDHADNGLQALSQRLKDRGDDLHSWWDQINDEHPRAYVGMTGVLVGVVNSAESLLIELRSGIEEAGLAPRVEIIKVDAQVEELVRQRHMPRGGGLAVDPLIGALRAMDPQEFEDFVARELRENGFEVYQVGRVNSPDGGIDMIAIPEQVRIPLMIAVQVKHHHAARTTSVGSVRDFAGAIYNKPFSAGMLVTNTSFTPSARLFAENSLKPLYLRDLEALRAWISGTFLRDVEWRELPEELEIAPGIRVPLRPRRKP